MKIVVFLIFFLSAFYSAKADDLIGFPRESYGSVVLSHKQTFAAKLEGSVGSYNNEPISLYSERSMFARLGRPVGRLDILTDIRVFPCTAFLISDRYLITNYHCVPGVIDLDEVREKGATRIESVQMVLGYTREGIEEDAQRFTVSPLPVEKNKELDYSILEVSGRPGAKFGAVELANSDPYDNQPFLIIGHPLGSSQRISREQCVSASPALSGGRLRHKCDTLPGNSGSPVFDQDSRAVIALHHSGSSRDSINYAVPMSQIIRQSRLLQALMESKRRGSPKVAAVDAAKPSERGKTTRNELDSFASPPLPKTTQSKNWRAWMKLCHDWPTGQQESGAGGTRKACTTFHERLDAKSGRVYVSTGIEEVQGKDHESFLVLVPPGQALEPGLQIRVDDTFSATMKFDFCVQTGCFAKVKATSQFLEHLKKGKQLLIVIKSVKGKVVGIPVPLAGFVEAYNGPPSDNEKYKADRKKLLDRARAKLNESDKKQ